MVHLVQWGCGELGRGDTEEQAIADARSYGASVNAEEVVRYTGEGKTGDRFPGKMLTDRGELAEGDLVMMTGEQFLKLGYK